MDKILDEIKAERARQDAKWGPQKHKPYEWCMILGEEVGEVNRVALELYFDKFYPYTKLTKEDYKKELIQVAAVCVHMIECIDDNK